MKAKIAALIGLFIFIGLNTNGQSVNFRNSVQSKLKDFAKVEGLENASWSFGLWDVKTGKVVATIRPNLLMTPASTLKAFTTAAMLDKFGKDFRYTTSVVKYKNLITIEGSGDPSLGSNYLDDMPEYYGPTVLKNWADKIEQSKVLNENIYFLGNTDAFEPNLPESYTWGDLGNYYGAGPKAINWMDNTSVLTFKTGNVGSAGSLKSVSPKPAYEINWVTKLTVDKPGTGDQAYVFGTSTDKMRLITGKIPSNSRKLFEIKAAMPEPELQLISQLQKYLDSKDVKYDKQIRTTNIWSNYYTALPDSDNKEKVLITYQSPDLATLVKKCNEFSLNHFADCFLFKLGSHGNDQVTLEKGLESLNAFAKKMDVPAHSFYIQDGSGLSPANAISAAAFGSLLLNATKAPWYPEFENSLAIAGKTGTMKELCLGTSAVGNLKVKTGSLTRVINYVGYFKGKDGRKYAIALMVNKYTIPYAVMRRNATKLLSDLTDIRP